MNHVFFTKDPFSNGWSLFVGDFSSHYLVDINVHTRFGAYFIKLILTLFTYGS